MHRGCLPNGGARGEDFARNEIPHPCCVLNLSAKVYFLFEIAIDLDRVAADRTFINYSLFLQKLLLDMENKIH